MSKRNESDASPPDDSKRRRSMSPTPGPSSSPQTSPVQNDSQPKPSIEWILTQTFDRHFDPNMKRLERKALFTVRHNLDEVNSLNELEQDIDTAFGRAVRQFFNQYHPEDRVSLNISSEGLIRRIYLRPVPIRNFNDSSFRHTISLVAQSNREFLMSKEMRVQFNIYHSLRGGGRSHKRIITQDENSKRKHSVVCIRNPPGTVDCGYRAITLGVLYYELNVRNNATQNQWRNIRQYQNTLLRHTKDLLHRHEISEELLEEELDDQKLRLFDQKLTDYQIIVIDSCSGSQLFVGTDRHKVIYLEDCGRHFNLITSMTGYRGRDEYCKYCNTGYMRSRGHTCRYGCNKCQSPSICVSEGVDIECVECHLNFESNICFTQHKQTLCKIRRKCPQCEVIYNTRNDHFCGFYHCNICKENYNTQPHECFIRTLDISKLQKEDKVNNILIAYDIEAQLVRQNDGDYLHVPFLLVMTMSCDKCQPNSCLICGQKWFVFKGEDCVDLFVGKIRTISGICQREKAFITVFAHNNARYDGHFVFRSMLNMKIKGFDLTMRGLGLMKVEIGNVRFIDSLLLLQAPLAKLPKIFGLDGGGKGFFPYYFRRRDGLLKIGDIPKEEFGYGQMNESRAKEFDQWYVESKELLFNYDQEAENYCRNDVRILMEAIIVFRRLFKAKSGIDPINRAFTIAGISFEFFRAKHMKDFKFHICPIKGFFNHNQSASGNAFLDYIEKEIIRDYERPIIREYKIGKYNVDGFVDLRGTNQQWSGIVIEYHGCFFHNHHPNQCTLNRIVDLEKNTRDIKRLQLFDKLGYDVRVFWECQWKAILEQDQDTKEYFDNRVTHWSTIKNGKLYCDARKAYKGGLVDSFKFVWKAKPGENIRYIDFNSLYPHVMTTFPVPVGKPIVFNEGLSDLIGSHFSELFGLISCKVSPPDNVMFPILHTNINGKQMYPLCYNCAKKENVGRCQCAAKDRLIKGQWTTIEIQYAVRHQGYTIVKVYQIVHYTERDNQMFANYIKELYVDKQEASGWPAECQTEEQKAIFCAEFERRMGKPLDPYKISNDPGRKAIPKLCMNSCYGKLGQSCNMPQALVTKSRSEAWDLICDPDKEILTEERVNDHYIYTFKYIDDIISYPGNTSVVVAAFITANARILLIKEASHLHESGQHVLYCDTDSLVYVEKPNSYQPDIGPFLGQLSDEVEGEYGFGAKIIEFYTTGPKSYCYKVLKSDGSIVPKIKSKGLTLNVDAMETLTFEAIADKAIKKSRGEDSGATIVKQNQFRLNRQHIISSKHIEKRFRVTQNKRMAIGNDTFPFGWRDHLPNDMIVN